MAIHEVAPGTAQASADGSARRRSVPVFVAHPTPASVVSSSANDTSTYGDPVTFTATVTDIGFGATPVRSVEAPRNYLCRAG